MSLKDTPAPATGEELNAYQSFLFQHKLYALAYYAWRQFLPPEQLADTGYLFNGDFEVKPSGSPFDWQAPAGVNVVVDFASRSESALDHALVAEFGPGRVEFPGVYQSILLPPGAYSFRGSFKGEVVGRRGVLWDISCRDGASLGHSEMSVSYTHLNAFGEAYVASNLDKRFQANAYAKSFLEDQLQQLKLRLEAAENGLLAFAEKEQILAGSDKTSVAETNFGAANSALGSIIAERIKNEQLWRQVEKSSGIDVPQLLTNKTIDELRARRGQLVAEYQEKSQTFRADYPAMAQLSNKIKEIEHQIGLCLLYTSRCV